MWEIKSLDNSLVIAANRKLKNFGSELRKQYYIDQQAVDESSLTTPMKKFLFFEFHRIYSLLLKERANGVDPQFFKVMRLRVLESSVEKELRRYIEKLRSQIK